jgi:GT2 family glycosyltransferase
MISLIIPTTSKNQEYTDNLISNIRSLYPNESEVEIIVETNDTVTLGKNYNNAVSRATGEKIILLHNDMVIPKGFIELMDKHITDNRITTYTRIEPPIYTDIYPGKRILDCGSDLNSFDSDKFEQLELADQLTDGGSQLFFGCMKKDYIGIDGVTFKMFCEDDDLHRRYKLLGYEHKVSSAFVYHFVSKTSRSEISYQQIELQSNRNYIRKWGTRSAAPKYNIGIRVAKCNIKILELLEPYCDRIYIDDDMQVITTHYIESEQPNTKFDLTKRIMTTTHNNPHDYDDIVVELDATRMSQQDAAHIMMLPQIIQDSGTPGTFRLGNLQITINHLETYEKNLIKLN